MKNPIIPATIADKAIFLEMALELWPDYNEAELDITFQGLLSHDKYRLLLYLENKTVVAFIYLSIRSDYVEGSDSSPVGYLEGIYVKPPFRRKGIATKLLEAGTKWLKEKGCCQMGSDIYWDNNASYDFHTRSGFKEAGRLIAFIKTI